MELSDYWKTVRDRWRTVFVVAAAVVAVAALFTWLSTPEYSSSTRLFLATSDSDASQAFSGTAFATQRVASYADIVPKSRQLADEVSKELGDGLDAGSLSSHVTASVVPNTVNLEITATDTNAMRARDIAQAYAQSLRDLVAQYETPEGATEPLIKAEIFDSARVNPTPVSPQPVRNIGLGVILGMLLGVGLAVTRELLDNSVSTAEDVVSATAAPIVGRITADTSSAQEPPSKALVGTSSWAEAFRVLRTNMQYIEVDNEQKVFVVTSSLPSEGKSTTAVNLAVTLALTNQKVALVECDLRRPLIAKRIGIDGAIGTTSVLIGRVGLHEALQTHAASGLRVLACGPIPPNPSELLQSKAMQSLLTQLRAEFDVVILDAPPLLPVTDAALLAAQADGALVVVRHGKTNRDQLAHAVERLDQVDAKTLGVVLNMVPARGRGGSYSYAYSYAYSAPPEAPTVSGQHGELTEQTSEPSLGDQSTTPR